ncbi:hypothetical protein [Marinilactibacillus psychrotolerans]|uniref:Uncharacterized protein n=1 Tax=Marinilactibacillus psychrotolerans TaxID=191770 RepID=A0A5R9C076_9LACT|nr:hypothetical protein [Marinilactibacillus psychrotolerans]TLQ06071.1 hypothetical protein FEZ48_11305 [Marinilactibacillus psychrotolerans]
MANVWQLPHKYDTSRYHTVALNSGSKNAFQIGGDGPDMRVLIIHDNGVISFTDTRRNEIWTSRPLTDVGGGRLEFKG